MRLNFFGNKGGGGGDNGNGPKRVAAELKSPVVLFTTATCPFCKQAKALLDSVGATYKEVYTHLPKGAMSFLCPIFEIIAVVPTI
jgi:hypothetical protein